MNGVNPSKMNIKSFTSSIICPSNKCLYISHRLFEP